MTNTAWLPKFLRWMFTFFVIATAVGALTGIGIWVHVNIINPAAIGALLRETRENYGGDLERIAAALRIKPAYLTALEEGRYDRLPAPVYALGFVRAYAIHMGLDGEEAVRRFKQEANGLEISRNLVFPIPLADNSIPRKPILIAGLLLLIAAYAVWYYFSSGDSRRPERVSEVPAELMANQPGAGAAPSAPAISPPEASAATASPSKPLLQAPQAPPPPASPPQNVAAAPAPASSPPKTVAAAPQQQASASPPSSPPANAAPDASGDANHVFESVAYVERKRCRCERTVRCDGAGIGRTRMAKRDGT